MSDKHPIRRYRDEAKVSQGKLAQEVGVTRFTVMRWERGDPPNIRVLPKLAQVTGISAATLRPDLVDLVKSEVV